MGSYGQPVQTNQHQSWSQPQAYNNPAPQSPYQSRVSPVQMGNAMPYAHYPFGQLPAHLNPHDPKSQHPIPGSYNRHAFNPKTQSFVPGNGMSPVQASIAPYNASGMHGSPQIGPAHLAYGSYSSANQQPYMGGSAYGMSRQGSNSSLPPYHQNPHIPHMGTQAMAMKSGIPPQGMPPGVGQQSFTHLSNYGNPASLPQKPPSGI